MNLKESYEFLIGSKFLIFPLFFYNQEFLSQFIKGKKVLFQEDTNINCQSIELLSKKAKFELVNALDLVVTLSQYLPDKVVEKRYKAPADYCLQVI